MAGVFHLGRTLDIRAIAERVESAAQASFVRPHCDGMQGFAFARPMAAGDMTQWLAAHGNGDPATGAVANSD
jgi:EAL domain-containing protein (putative c-di-GMP-specific phosphodiesterase class I)